MYLITANEATAAQRRVYFHLVDVTDGLTAETGEAGGQPQISTNGAAWTNTGIGTLSAVGNGRYYADLTQAAVATAGDRIETRYKSAATAECPGDSVQVVAFDMNDTVRLGLTALPNADAQAAGGLYTRGTGAGQINQSANGQIDVNAERLNNVVQSLLDLKDFADDGYDPSTNKVQGVVLTDTATNVTNLHASAATAASIAALNNLSAAQVNAEVDTALSDYDGPTNAEMVARTLAAASYATAASIAALNNLSAAQVNSEVDTALADYDAPTHAELTAALAAADDAVLAAIAALNNLSASQVNAEVDTALADVGLTTTVTGRIDAAISSRLASGSYTVPLDAAGTRAAVGLATANLDTQLSAIDDFLDTEVAAIKAKTDNLPSDPADASDIAALLMVIDDFLDTEVAAIKTVTDKIDDTLEDDGGTYRFTTNALEQSPSGGGAPTVEEIAAEVDSVLSGTHGSGEWDFAEASVIYGEGGSITYTYTVYDTDDETPLPGASVYVSADSEGEQRSQAKVTDALGRVRFDLDSGTVYFWRSHPSRTFSNPDEEEVS